ncbi:ribosome biogenesis GTPase RsgA [Aerococcus urinaehominis]|uniref:Small ribosomal subunit biogenesis GTPase RsgA n=1 Tax=Aerococcus urinaehominis TaxID=128944 RepID=A0A0X8FKH3_9LACT|nr:ribosome small subunit-dependent GTPase A [Aerococcus urinaehominis]AMB98972.1 ribosome biogenesis GTPase RsgA [Aerococcus urinaehominis]SDM37409.1 ribosome biogenesis GTPase [Aerococcus urinaehominis]
MQEKEQVYQGQVEKALSGFYYIRSQADGQIYQTRARGQFRNTNTKPLVGDYVDFIKTEGDQGYLVAIHDRKNALVRPAVANVDLAFLVCSVVEPQISPKLIDRYLVYLESLAIQPLIYFSKLDLLNQSDYADYLLARRLYESVGYQVFDNLDAHERLDELASLTQDQLMVVVGQSGVGKSTFLNQVLPELALETGAVSQALGRGRHTTRHVELHHLLGGQIVDTPGFSSISFDHLDKRDLASCFPEMRDLAPYCKFRECTHIPEPKCAVKAGLVEGTISQERYDSYLQLFEEISQIKPDYR